MLLKFKLNLITEIFGKMKAMLKTNKNHKQTTIVIKV